MIVDTFVQVGSFLLAIILNLFPDGSMPSWYDDSDIFFEAIGALASLPIFDTLFVILAWIVWFELTFFTLKLVVMFATWARMIGGGGKMPIK